MSVGRAKGGGGSRGDTPPQRPGVPSPGPGCGAGAPPAPAGLRGGVRGASVLSVLEQRALEPEKNPEAAARGCRCRLPPGPVEPPLSHGCRWLLRG